MPAEDGIIRPPKCVVVDDTFDWEGDRHLRRPLSETIIYEMHVRGFTRSPTQRRRKHPGTYRASSRRFRTCKSLGVTAVELMPVHEFPIERASIGTQADPPELLGLRPAGVSSRRTAATCLATSRAARCGSSRRWSASLHAAGIEVILDVVFNHTAEGNDTGPDAQLQGAGEPRLLHARRRRHLQELLRLRQHGQRQSPDRPRDDLPLPAALGSQLPHRWLPLRPGVDPQPRPERRAGAESAAGRADRRRSDAGRHEDHRRSVGRRRRVPGRLVRRPALGRVERPLPRRRAPLSGAATGA